MVASDIDMNSAQRYDEANPSNLVVSDLNERKHDTDPSDELIDDVRKNGIEDPILLRPTDDPEHEYEVVAGQLRLKAILETHRDTVPVEIRGLNDTEAYRESIRENYRGDLGKDVAPLDRAKAIQEWWESRGEDGSERPSTTAVADEFGVSPSTASRWIEPLRDEWADLRDESDDGDDDFHRENLLNTVSGSTLQEVRKAESDPDERTELVEKVAAGDETRGSIIERKKRGEYDDDATPFDKAEKFHVWYNPFVDMPNDEVQFVAEAEMDPQLFERHPEHSEIYHDTSIGPAIIESVERQGVIEAILVTPELVVISGWRRVLAARAAGREWIQVVVCDFASENHALRALILCNQYHIRNEFDLYELRDVVLLCDQWGLCDVEAARVETSTDT